LIWLFFKYLFIACPITTVILHANYYWYIYIYISTLN
jgi:hypothetical protein